MYFRERVAFFKKKDVQVERYVISLKHWKKRETDSDETEDVDEGPDQARPFKSE